MVDFNIDILTKKVILGIIQQWQAGEEDSCETTWFSLTRRMFNKYPAVVVFGQVELALEQASDEQWFEHKYPKEVFMELDFSKPQEKRDYNPQVNGTGITAQITEKISIIDIARQFGLDVRGNKCKCPFHADSDPSLTFNEAKGWFKCWGAGCQAKGNIIKFYAMLKKLRPDFKYHAPNGELNNQEENSNGT